MTTIPSRLASVSAISGTQQIARQRVRALYRDWYRSAPQIVSLYALNISPSMIREKKRADFERHRGITDVNVIDMLIFKSKQEYQETMNCWKTEAHVMSWFRKHEVRAPPTTFMDKFLAGRDDPQVLLPWQAENNH
ncbi:hypothetical protein FFLO_07112 [Filobasidium floriforme]|uniref:NADH dehydrogenase [ubiquinone] 1 alpha subcomplex subunit 6 n=1 Tax=Filobasidium floriforme TaxID=5210 RepID=A0A8K0NME1_9TREE|nr:hypothetical protein FFLO_07112 [Filobasidium floriforme]